MLNMIHYLISSTKKIKSLKHNKVISFIMAEKIGELDYKCKNFSLMAPELEFMKSQNIEISQ